MLIKDKVVAVIESLPERFSISDLMEKLVLLDKIEKGSIQYNNNDVVSEVDLHKEIETWFR